MKLNLPDSVSSAQDLSALTMEIHEYAKWFAHNAIKERAHAKRGVPPPIVSAGALELIRSCSGTKLLTQKSLDDLIHELELFKKTASIITITLAAPPTGDIKATLVAWCRKNISKNILVNFRFNSTLLGGMVVRFGSHVFDWSFRRQILNERSKFPEVIRRV